jgi:beta-galactosidase
MIPIKNLLLAAALMGAMTANRSNAGDEQFTVPVSQRATYNFNPGWKFIKQDVPGAEAPAFDDSSWETVSTPHTYNDVDTFHNWIRHSSGETQEYMGPAWYRKHFKLPVSAAGCKVFLEFEGLKQAGRFWVNGKPAGKIENGITACGLDIGDLVYFDGRENVLAVKVDNSNDYVEEATKTGYEWMGRAFNPNYGGLNHDVWLHITGKIYQTLPLYENLGTTGIYVYGTNYSPANNTCDVAVESQVRNESGDIASIDLSAVVVDAAGVVRATMKADTSDLVNGQTDTFTATGHLAGARFWSPQAPCLYDVYSILTVNGKTVDVCKVQTGFRQTEFKGGAGKGGVYINGQFVYLKGYAQRSTNEWAGMGQAYPDWMHDCNAEMIRESNANYIRWMHISPQRVDETAFDKFGIVNICPAGDKEKDADGRQWDQRVEVMRDSMIYMRNHPSILFWEAGNNGISAAHMQQMVDLRKQWDPNGGRVIGCRSLETPDTNSIAEYFGTMIGEDPAKDKRNGPQDIFRAYSDERRDKAPIIEAEDFREEASRRFWDDFSPPHFGFKKGPEDTYNLNSETFSLAAAARYFAYWSNRISNPDPAHAKWSGYASIYWSDSNADGRQDSSEVCRVSGKVDAVRLPKEAFYTYRVMQNDAPDIHILGHWTYPANTVKTMYVISNCEEVELFVNGMSKGRVSHPTDGYVFAFPSIAWEPGKILAVGYKAGERVCEHELQTAGSPVALKLKPLLGPGGLRADGSDVALFNVEAIDAAGRRCPTDEARVDFSVTGPCIWRGGYNSGVPGSTNNLYLNTECGVNRVAIRSTLQPGEITLTASRAGLTPAKVVIRSVPFEVKDGLATGMPETYPGPAVK